MKQILTLSLLILSISCTTTTREASSSSSSELSIALTPTFEPAASRATSSAFEEGDQIGLYAVIVGQELKAAGNHTDNAQFTASADGVIAADPALYYPDSKSAVTLYAYYPYNSSVADATKMPFTVTDDLKASDLCYAQREALPSKEAQTLQFKHSLSRVVVNVNFDSEPKVKSVTSVKFINTATDFTVDLNTGTITLGEQGETLATNQLSANQYEAIVAPQTFAARQAMLRIEVLDQNDAPQSYYYAPFEALTLTEAALNTLNIVLNDHNIATMKGSPQIADWTATAKSDIARKDVSNRFTAHWLIAEPQFASVNKIMLTVKDSLRNSTTKLTADNVKLVAGSSLAAASYTFDFAPSGLDYPYTIQSVEFYNGMTLISSVIPNISTVVYKTGAMTFGVDRKAVLTLSGYSTSVAAHISYVSFNLTSNVPYSSAYSAGSSSAEGEGNTPPYNNKWLTFNFPAQGAVATAAKTHTMTITPAVDYLVGSQRRTFTVTQAAVPCTFALSATTASVGAQVTSAAFTLSSNAPYTSTITSGASSPQASGSAPPYTNLGVTFTFPAQGTAPAMSRSHTMTVTQSADATIAPKSGAFIVTQAGVPPTLSISSNAPGVTIPSGGYTYLTNISSNTAWKAVATNATVVATGSGDMTSFAITANANPGISTREVSVVFTTTANASQPAVSHAWRGMQEGATIVNTAPKSYFTLVANVPVLLTSISTTRSWTVEATLPSWLKITKGAVLWANATASNTLSFSGGVATVNGSADLYLIADPNTLNVTGGNLSNGQTIAWVDDVKILGYNTRVFWTHSFKNTNVAGRHLIWAAGNLVSYRDSSPQTGGLGKAYIGNMYDGGLYFKFGSLVGLKGGANGSGVGTAVATHDTGYWVRPTGNTNTDWANAAYFQGSQTSGEFNALVEDNATSGVGDACRYYLGAPWRLPTGQEYADLCNKQYVIGINSNWTNTGGKETSPTTTPATNLYGGWWDGTAAFTAALANSVYFVASGYKDHGGGEFYGIGTQGVYWGSSIGNPFGLHLSFLATVVTPQSHYFSTTGSPLRCVQ